MRLLNEVVGSTRPEWKLENKPRVYHFKCLNLDKYSRFILFVLWVLHVKFSSIVNRIKFIRLQVKKTRLLALSSHVFTDPMLKSSTLRLGSSVNIEPW